MPLTIGEARELGKDKLGVRPDVFTKAMEHAEKLCQRPADLGPLTLCLAILGGAKVVDPSEIQDEMVDAMQLIDKAEKEWRMEMAIRSAGRVS